MKDFFHIEWKRQICVWETNIKKQRQQMQFGRRRVKLQESYPLKHATLYFILNLIIVISNPADAFFPLLYRLCTVFLYVSSQYLLPQQQKLAEQKTDWKRKCHVTRLLEKLCVRYVCACVCASDSRQKNRCLCQSLKQINLCTVYST